jgi:pimeloyl-ACP methyl ester carboxylesterase
MKQRTHYARSGDLSIAYQVIGDHDLDLVAVPGWVSHVEWSWEDPGFARMLRSLASFSRLIFFDKRGTGLSDPVPQTSLPTLEERMDDLRAVMDAAGSDRAAILGVSEGAPLALLFAATYPQRVTALVLYGGYPRWIRSPDFPHAPTREQHEVAIEAFAEHFGGPVAIDFFAPSRAGDKQFRSWWATFMRLGGSPGACTALYRTNIEVDVRHILPTIQVPTLLLHRVDDQLIRIGCSRYMAERIPDARLVELPGADHLMWVGDTDTLIGEIQEFLTGAREASEPERVLVTVLFVDAVGSTRKAAELGDRAWRDLQESFLGSAERQIARFRGRLIDTAGDGFLAAFDGPARAIRCAQAMREAASKLSLEIRAGVHTGECEVLGDKLSGIAVHLGARVSSKARAGEILVSGTVRDLVVGSGLEFSDRGVHELDGIEGEWRLLAVAEA